MPDADFLMNPKFQLGDVVAFDFKGEVEGIAVVVRKQLFVHAVCIETNIGRSGYHFMYNLCERNPAEVQEVGKQYGWKQEHELIELEPLVQSAVKSQSNLQKPQGRQLTNIEIQSKDEILKSIQARQRAEALQNYYGTGVADVNAACNGLHDAYSVDSLLNAIGVTGTQGKSHTPSASPASPASKVPDLSG